MGTVANSSYDECAVYTCDYDAGGTAHPGHFDYQNAWVRGKRTGGTSEIDETSGHFGEASVHVVNSFGPTRNVNVDPSKDYIFSAWVRNGTGSEASGKVRFAVEIHNGEPGVGTQIGSYDHEETGLSATEWTFVEHRIRSSELASHLSSGSVEDIDWYRIWIGNNSPDTEVPSVDVYMDDIRFFPADGMVSTVYYNMEWRKPMLTVDANNNPSRFMTFDEFGRQSKTYKINKTKSIDDENTRTPAQGWQYHLMGDDLRVVFPSGGEILRGGQEYTISWAEGDVNLDEDGVDLLFFDGTNWTQLVSAVKNQTSYVWTVPSQDATGCKIKLIAHDNADIVHVSNEFAIVVNSPPTTPWLVSPGDRAEIEAYATADDLAQNGKVITLSWQGSTDPDGDPVAYEIQVCRYGDGPEVWTTVADNYRSTSYDLKLYAWGIYGWKIVAKDGITVAPWPQRKFYLVPEDWFVLWDVYDKMIHQIPPSLYSEIHAELSLPEQEAFAHTYRREEDGWRRLADAGYFVRELTNGETITYRIKTATELGDPGGWRIAYDGGIIGMEDREIRKFILERVDGGTSPQLTIDQKWLDNLNREYDKGPGTWGTLFYTSTGYKEMNRMKLTTSAPGLHFWYRTWERSQGSSASAAWKTNGEWTPTWDDGASHVQIYLCKY